MTISTAVSMLALRAADPSLDQDMSALVPDWQSVLAAIDNEAPEAAAVGARAARPARPARRATRLAPPRTRRVRLALAAVVVAVAAICAGVIAWPGSGHGPASVAYGVTRQSDGTVSVRQSPTHHFTATELQAELRAAGVPAVVLDQSAPGACTEAPPSGIQSARHILTYPNNIDRSQGFLINPKLIPAGAELVVVLPGAATSSTTEPAFAGLFVTFDTPSCVARPSTVDPSDSSSAANPSSPSK